MNTATHPNVNVTPDGDASNYARQVSDDSDYSDFESDEFEEEDDDDHQHSLLRGPKNLGAEVHDHRAERVRELVATELEYIHDLEILTQVTTGDTAKDKYNVLDMKIILGNITEVLDVGRRFFLGLKEIAYQIDDEMAVGKVCLRFVEELAQVYKVYCSAYNVDVLPLMKKYEQEEATSTALKEIAIELRSHKKHLLDLNCVLIKPVQRFLKYPLYLDELVNKTPDDHLDFKNLQDAKTSFQSAAKEINEYTRGIDLIHKYRETNHSLHNKLRRLNLHSLARTSFRVTRKLSEKLGVPSQVQTLKSDLKQLETKFHGIKKTARSLVKNVADLVEAIRCRHTVELIIAEVLFDVFPEATETSKIRLTALDFCNKLLQMFDNEVQQRVLHPARQVLVLCEGPSNIIQKTRKIMVDYDIAQIRLQAALEPAKIASVIEESAGIRSSYEALSNQLMTELPIFIKHSIDILTLCTQSLVGAHMYLQGHLAKLYLKLTEEPGLSFMTPEEAKEKARQRTENLLQILPNAYQKKHTAKKKETSVKKTEKPEEPVEMRSKPQERSGDTSRASSSAEFFKSLPSIAKGRSRRSYPLNNEQPANQTPKESSRMSASYEYFKSWSPSNKIRQRKSLFTMADPSETRTEKRSLEKQYPASALYTVVEGHAVQGDNELNLHPGDVIAVLKKQDPMGGEGRWVVDNGEKIGVIRKECLKLDEDSGNADEESVLAATDAIHMPSPVTNHMAEHEDSPYQPSSAASPADQEYSEHSHHEDDCSESSDEWYNEESVEGSEFSIVQGTSTSNQDTIPSLEGQEPRNIQEHQYMVLYSFTAAESSQLSVKKDQVVVGIHTEYPDWWYMKDDYGHQGYVPASYLVKQL